MVLSCRFYGERFPEIDDVVMVNVKSIGEMGAYVHLLEYKNIEGMILLSELSRRRIRSINKLIRVGRNECVVVIRVDKEKGYIDLSKRRVSPEDIERCEEKFARGKTINSILRHVGEILGYSEEKLEELYEKTAWFFDKKANKPTASYDVFKAAVQNHSILDECGLEQSVKELLLVHIQRRLMPQTVKVRSEIEVGCYAYDGVDAVKRALKAGMALGTEEMPIKINLIAPPRYVMTSNTIEKEAGVELLKRALTKIQESINETDGIFSVIQEPKVVTDIDEAELAKQMEKAEKEVEQVSGDDDSDEEAPEVSENFAG